MSVHDEAVALSPDLIALRRRLHQIPELGLDLPRTRAEVLTALEGLDLEIIQGVATTSVTAILRGGRPGPVVLIRADMDGLPITEETGLDYASTTGTMHACGHDLHVAGLVGAIRLLHAHRDDLPGTVVAMFQPGEEGHKGAGVMLDEGLLDVAGSRPIAAYGLHVWGSLEFGRFFTRPGAVMASSNILNVTVHGRAGHASAPQTGLDPVPVAAEIILGLQSLVARHHDVFDPVVISVTKMQAGVAVNATPPRASIEATVRALSAASLDQLDDELPRLADGIAAAYGASAETEFIRVYPVTMNDPDETETSLGVLRDTFGTDRVELMSHPMMGAEDFSFVLERVPGTFVIVGARPPALADAAGNHSSQVQFDDAVLADMALALATLARQRLEAAQEG